MKGRIYLRDLGVDGRIIERSSSLIREELCFLGILKSGFISSLHNFLMFLSAKAFLNSHTIISTESLSTPVIGYSSEEES
jgi:hypothetical protein